jgi:hypothetical protein
MHRLLIGYLGATGVGEGGVTKWDGAAVVYLYGA